MTKFKRGDVVCFQDGMIGVVEHTSNHDYVIIRYGDSFWETHTIHSDLTTKIGEL